jgi:hypothetical protein
MLEGTQNIKILNAQQARTDARTPKKNTKRMQPYALTKSVDF